MNKPEFINNVSRTFHKVGLQLKKHSPEILVVAGVAGTVVSAVMACKATTKVDAILAETKEKVEGVHSVLENPVIAQKYVEKYGEEFTPEDAKKELAVIYVKTGLEFIKLYGPSVLLGSLSITSILASNNILRKRNVALAAAYATVDKGFKEYRGRVIERFGKELDRELKYNLKSQEIEEVVTNEDGSETTVKKTVEVMDTTRPMYSPYSVIYDDGCKGWQKDPEANKFFLVQCQNWANEKLKAQGHLFLNDVYEMIGINKTKAGHVVGWVYDKENPIGDNYVDFGIFDIYNEKAMDFVNGRERNIILDFNVDGNVYDLVF